MALSEIDRSLLHRCLEHQPRCWEDFVDRFLGLVIHVVNHTARCRSIRLNEQDREDLTADVFLAILDHDYAILRHFRGESSLATYLTVIARRVVVRRLIKEHTPASIREIAPVAADPGLGPEQRMSDHDEVRQLLDGLDDRDAEVIRMYHLEGRSYQEISSKVGMPENSIGPTLSRARERMRRSSPSS